MSNNQNAQYKELKKNTIIIAVANLGSKAISFILAPIYSYFLNVGEYGTMDLITTTASLVTPIICLDIFEATFRFSCNQNNERGKVLSTSLAACMLSILCPLVILIGNKFVQFDNFSAFLGCSLYIMVNTFVMVLEQYNRGIKKMRVYAYGGVVNSAVLLLSNVLFMLVLKKGLTGWILSFVLGKTGQLVFLLFMTDLKVVSFKNVQKDLFKIMLRYCLPLLPTQVMWWVMNASDRYVLTAFAGSAAVGLYSVGNKIPHLLSLFENIFYQSWQTSAVSSYDSEERDIFYSDVFNKYFSILTVGVLGLLIVCKPAIDILFEKSYAAAWLCVSPLVIGVLVHALGGNLGSFYVVFKKTHGALITSLVGALTNIILNFIFIPKYGFVAAAYTTLVGYIATLIVRWIDVRKMINIRLTVNKTIVYIVLIVAQTCLYYIITPISYIIRIIIFTAILINEHRTLLSMIKR